MNLKKHARLIVNAAINSVHPENLIRDCIQFDGQILKINSRKFNLDEFRSVSIIGAGKASAAMAFSLQQRIGDKLSTGFIITNYGNKIDCGKIEVVEAGHPISDANSLAATEKLLNLVQRLSESDLVICLISGGASALMESPLAGFTLTDIQNLNSCLLACGANIEEINILRKRFSKVKGGKLAAHIYPAQMINLVVSDVINDPLPIIGSGPLSPDYSTFKDAWNVVEKYDLQDEIPVSMSRYLQQGLTKMDTEMRSTDNRIFSRVFSFILGNNERARRAAIKHARVLCYKTIEIADPVQGEAREAAKKMVQFIRNQNFKQPTAIIWGGETTVRLRKKGKGGRNQEFVLAALAEMEDRSDSPFVLLSCGTDGRDGPTDAAGAMINEISYLNAINLQLDPKHFLDEHDSYTFFSLTDGLVKTGSTGTNVMDIGLYLGK
ncbi:MAG: DUF4147 domain-containing protein [Calditrichaeota bacterium]|nr:MAG: DUF4147 domain-containing protein [Calditrichota bacterium]